MYSFLEFGFWESRTRRGPRKLRGMDRRDYSMLQGYLDRKLKPNICNLWKKQWFVLRGKTLAYYKSKEQYEYRREKPAGVIDFYTVQAVHAVYNTGKSWAFDIVTQTRTIHLAAAEGEETCDKWVRALQQALQRPVVSAPLAMEEEEEPRILCHNVKLVRDCSIHSRSKNSVDMKVRSMEVISVLDPALCDTRAKSLSHEVIKTILDLHPEYASKTFEDALF